MHAHPIDHNRSSQQPEAGIGDNVEYRIDKAAALKACGTARDCLAAGRLNDAEPLLISALESRPACHLAYRLLGKLYDRSGRAQDAVDCFQGRLPAAVVSQYFKTSQAQATVRPDIPACKRQSVFAAEKWTLPAPRALAGVRSGAFKQTEVTSAECFVDTVDTATLWHDTTNTLVLNADGSDINRHTVGNASVMHALMQRYKPRHLKGRAVLLGARGSHNYYHWLADIIPRLKIVTAAGNHLSSIDTFIVPVAEATFTRDLLAKAGVSAARIYETETQTPYLQAEQLIVPFLSNRMGYTMGRWLPRYLQQVMLWRLSSVPAGNRHLFINRREQTAAGRTLQNQQQVEKYFQQRGFEVVQPESLSVTAQAELFSQASVVVAAHGAGLSNIVYCAPGTKIIEFYGAHIAPCYWAISGLNELDYYQHCCVADEDPISEGRHARDAAVRRSAGFSIPLEAAEQLLQLAGVS